MCPAIPKEDTPHFQIAALNQGCVSGGLESRIGRFSRVQEKALFHRQ